MLIKLLCLLAADTGRLGNKSVLYPRAVQIIEVSRRGLDKSQTRARQVLDTQCLTSLLSFQSMSSIETLSPGVAQSGVADQYADGVAAKNWLLYIGEQTNRTTNYRDFLINLLKEKKAYTILDAACGTGVDSVMLIEEMGQLPAFALTSCDFSDKMLKTALKTRWDRRRDDRFFNWTIEEGNWMTLNKDVKTPGAGYDAIICMGNSFPHLVDDHGDFRWA